MAAAVHTGVCRGSDTKKRGSSEPWRSKRVERLAELEALGHMGSDRRISQPKDILAFCSMAPEFFLGRWTDSMGSSICVYSADAFEVRLVVTISRSSRPDLYLNLVPRPDGWHCGEARLNVSKSSSTKVCWVFPKGKESFWMREQEDSERKEPTPPKHLRPDLAVQSLRAMQRSPALFAPLPSQALWVQSQGQLGPALATLSAPQVSRTLVAPRAHGLMLPVSPQQAQWPPWGGRPPLRMWFA
eukprot:CAMPEP_0172721842 /NCGR_PEP_ID=MMETSP1074-20121228/80026_1 /TAXON_ID=2916 /ORGANISM="Ceratium fusus, Strain PA161109" /LENGTH=242 /DNA_ID=CAMNT_0013547693 /DNA_START=116 /DNA_END=844 /DNA_ORIENTATION=-